MIRPKSNVGGLIEFDFKNIKADLELRNSARRKLFELLDLAPINSSVLGKVEVKDNYYMASVQIKSRAQNFEEKAAGTCPHSAVRRVLGKIENRLYQWRSGGNVSTNVIRLVRQDSSSV
jgi:hypothetical protein